MVSRSSIAMQSMGKIELRAPAVGAKMWCLCACYRQDCRKSDKLPVLSLLTGQKSGFSPRRGDWLHRFMSNLARPTDIWFSFAEQNCTSVGAGGGNVAQKYEKKILFFVKVHLTRPVALNLVYLALDGRLPHNTCSSIGSLWQSLCHPCHPCL